MQQVNYEVGKNTWVFFESYVDNKMFEDFRGWEIKKKKTLDILSKILN